MQNRQLVKKPIFKDLLTNNISGQQLTQFLDGLFTSISAQQAVKDTDEIDQPVFHNSIYYHTALVYATKSEHVEIAQALLLIGAHPNIYLDSVKNGSALLLAMETSPLKVDTFLTLYLAMTDINIYVTAAKKTIFDSVATNTAMIASLLNADRQISNAYSNDEINCMAITITNSRPAERNYVACQELAKIYGTLDQAKILPKFISDEFKMTPTGTPAVISSIIKSYLFLPKLESVKNFQERFENAPQTPSLPQNRKATHFSFKHK